MPEGIQCVSRSFIVEDHQRSLSLSLSLALSLSLSLSLLYMSHRALKLNVYAHLRLLTDRVVFLVFLGGSSLSNPMEARCIAPKDCIQKDDVLAYGRHMPSQP